MCPLKLSWLSVFVFPGLAADAVMHAGTFRACAGCGNVSMISVWLGGSPIVCFNSWRLAVAAKGSNTATFPKVTARPPLTAPSGTSDMFRLPEMGSGPFRRTPRVSEHMDEYVEDHGPLDVGAVPAAAGGGRHQELVAVAAANSSPTTAPKNPE